MQPGAERKGQLDSLRAFAVMLVLYAHFWNEGTVAGTDGVYLFFVLSGYLITGVLLRARGSATALRRFYLRRTLRIFPIYYLTLALAWLINLGGIRRSILWHLCYLSNIWFARQKSWADPWPADHLWTLSVEEQFYLLWPLLILYAPRRALRPAVWCIIFACICLQLSQGSFRVSEFAHLYTVSSLDKLGAGALLAFWESRGGFPGWLTRAGWAACAGLIAIHFCPAAWSGAWRDVLREELVVVVAAALIAAASTGISGPAGAVLNSRVIRYVGRISYGIYLFHDFIFGVAQRVFVRLGHTPLTPGPEAFLLLSTITIAAAALSWQLIEMPFNRMKDRFE